MDFINASNETRIMADCESRVKGQLKQRLKQKDVSKPHMECMLDNKATSFCDV